MRNWIDLVQLAEASEVPRFNWVERSSDSMFSFEAETSIGDDLLTVKFQAVRGEGGYDVSFLRGGTTYMNGAGKAFTVMNAVLEAIEEFVRVRRPKWLSFGARRKETSRIKLYQRLIPVLLRKFSDYEFAAEPKHAGTFVNYRIMRVESHPAPEAHEVYADQPTEPEKKPKWTAADDELLAALSESANAITYQVWSGEQTARHYDEDETIYDRIRYLHAGPGIEKEVHIVALEGGKVVGMSGMEINPYDTEELWGKFVSVDPDYRERGIGRRLVELTMKYAKEHGLRLKGSSYTDMGRERLKPMIKRMLG